MKKRVVALSMAAAMMFALTACGSASSDSASKDSSEVKPEDYVTLGELEGLQVTADTYTFTDEDVASQLQEEFEYYVDNKDAYDYQEITDRTDVQEGDFCNIDYEGLQDGTAFDGGSDTDYNLEIGSNSFIEGFETGLVGHQVGEQVSLNLTFPEDYTNTEMAGKEVVFNVTINKIQTRSMPEMTDDVVATLDLGYTTIADFEKEVRDYLQSSCDEQMTTLQSDAIWAAVKDACEIKDPPQSLIDTYTTEIKANVDYYAQMYGVESEEFITTYMGMDTESFDAEVATSATEAAKEELLVKAIAEKADVAVSDDDLNTAAEAEYADYGYDSADAFIEDTGKEVYRQYLLKDKVEEYLKGIVTMVDGNEINLLEEYAEDSEDVEVEDADTEETADDAAATEETAE